MTYSIGSSSVMMWSCRVLFTSSTSAASVVDLPRADRAGDEDEAVVILGEQLQALRQAEFIHRPQLGVDDAEDDVDAEPLPHDAGAEAAEGSGVGKIDVAALGEKLLLRVVEKAHGEPLGVRRR